MMRRTAAVSALMVLLSGCGGGEASAPPPATLTEVASSPRLWTGVACSADGRLFVNFPRWSADVPVSVAELIDGQAVPYPDERWNDWGPGEDPTDAFVCVQSVLADGRGSLWALDTGNPRFAGVMPGAAKLVRFDLATGEVVRVYPFAEPVVKLVSYLNDVRVDLAAGTAYLTDSGDGALVVLDLASGQARRLLDDHPATGAEDVVLTIEGRPWLYGEVKPQIHSDGLALGADRRYLYFQALTGRTLYKVPTQALRDRSLTAEALAAQVVRVAQSGAADGLLCAPDGTLYLSAIEENAVRILDPQTGQSRILFRGEALKWPDSFALDPQGRLLVTTSQIHLGGRAAEPYRLFRLDPTSE